MQGDMKIVSSSANCIGFYPIKPLSINDTRHSLREKGLFLLSDEMKMRTTASTTGIALVSDLIKRQIKIYSQNYFGDIFETTLNCSKDKVREDVNKTIDRMQTWDDFLKVEKNPHYRDEDIARRLKMEELVLDDIRSLKGLSKVIQCDSVPQNYTKQFDVQEGEEREVEKNNEEEEEEKSEERFGEMHTEMRPKWKMDIKDAYMYEDLLAKEVMAEWDDLDDDEDQEDLRPNVFLNALNVKQDNNVDKRFKYNTVESWLINNENEVEIVDSILIEEITELPPDNQTQEELLSNPLATSTQKSSGVVQKKKKPRIVGF
jgi:hypothetical protein